VPLSKAGAADVKANGATLPFVTPEGVNAWLGVVNYLRTSLPAPYQHISAMAASTRDSNALLLLIEAVQDSNLAWLAALDPSSPAHVPLPSSSNIPSSILNLDAVAPPPGNI
jgi:hypothetical protein